MADAPDLTLFHSEDLENRLKNLLNHSTLTPVRIVPFRGVIVSGGYCKYGKIVVVSFTFKSIINASNSPSIANLNVSPQQDTALSCIDISTGISDAIISAIPCGIGSNSSIYVQEIKNDHIYNVGGVFLVV